MGGIAVIYNLDGRPVDQAIFERMLSAIAHRGPDGCGRWIEGSVALGCQMFHTTPEALGEVQPLADAQGNRIVFDGRVDNREDLKAAVRAKGATPRDDTDAELVLCAYGCFGEDTPQRIIGDFALVIWNAAERTLFCARDAVGVRALYYHNDGRTLLIATELQQIFADPSVTTEPDEESIGKHLAGRFEGREDTLYRRIKRFPAAHQMSIRAGQITRRAYFDLDARKQIRYRNDDEYADHFREIFAEAVRCRMRAIGGIGAHLSGGLDSTSVAAIANRLRREGKVADAPLELFSLIFDHPDLDERRHIFEAVKALGLPANYPPPVPVDMAMCVEAVRRYRELPEYPNGGFWNLLWPAARGKGFRVLLSGTGSDEWLSGSNYAYAELLRTGRWVRLWSEVREDLRRPPAPRKGGAIGLVLRSAIWPLLPADLRKMVRRLLKQPPYPDFIQPAFAARIGLSDHLQRQPRRPAGMSFGQYALYQRFNSGIVARGLELLDRSTARFGVEERHPFHDRRLYEFAMGIPDDQRARDDRTKYVLRNAMRGLVPATILARRDKALFPILTVQALERIGGEHFFDTMTLESAGWIDRARFQRDYRVRIENYREASLWPLWMTFAIELWHRMIVLEQEPTLVAGAVSAVTATRLAAG
ncbi:MAG TPA: asparagine synthase-related protein [Candidatus Binataceae bacterium]